MNPSDNLIEAQELSPLEVLRQYRAHDFTLSAFLAARVAQHPDKPALLFEGETWSYGELAARIARTAAWLSHDMHIRAGDRVGVLSANHPSTVVLMFALAQLGATLVPANPDYRLDEALYVFEHAQICGLICSPNTLDTAAAVVSQLGGDVWLRANEAGGHGQALTGESEADTELRAEAASTAMIIYTSGTTGFPKGAMHGQRGYVLTAEAFVGRMHLQPNERVMCVMPLFHINALMYSVGGALACGGCLVLVRRFSASSFWRLAAESGATEVNLVAAAGSILARRPREEFVPGHRISKMFIAPQTSEMVSAMRHEFHVARLIECYGMTEIPGVIANPFHGPHKLGTMGLISRHPDPDISPPQARIIGEDGKDVAAGDSGELLIRTPTLMQGYYRDTAQTDAAFRDGWFATGDLVRQDDDGYYVFVARKKDVIRRKGENVSGAELDRVFGEHPAVEEAAAIGVPAELGEEEILLAVQLRAGWEVGATELVDWARDRLAAHKLPRFVVKVDQIPHTPTHKPAKHRLKADACLLARATDVAG
ncbi:class I adenylate-forming enzyme family protein [Cupriavidus metallidurans]|uniref:AMP-dependent synthetase and ligase n=1 Tax=Cupriavidus metallidurans (strain ATCC 43123 / DSM 2839 / NBRC 102507 / CH34) TaxID=266264 RepID=Q1LFE1_CUPMC|nr:AMP-binding protein [Cupriavidus metallidurans]ABF11135.1 AMP-dependent synthetase and ligase [Cupriavidus metallidurans CH34]QGS33082.1 AMP-binding protein [Cupriavidus metallidurans]